MTKEGIQALRDYLTLNSYLNQDKDSELYSILGYKANFYLGLLLISHNQIKEGKEILQKNSFHLLASNQLNKL